MGIAIHPGDIIAGVVYFLLLIAIGITFRSFSSDINDYLRAGCRGTWWLVGVATFMASFSAMTFVAIAGQSFVAGWSPMLITMVVVLSSIAHGLYFGPKFRQLRVTSNGDVMRSRFGIVSEQFVAYYGTITGMLSASLALVGTATFVSAVFGIPLWLLIICVGVAITIYSSCSGSWGILAAEFVQASVLVPVTISVTVLCLIEIGGFGKMFDMIEAQNLTADFALIKSHDHVYSTPVPLTPGLFTWSWLFGLVYLTTVNCTSLGAKYINVKDGKEARKTAFFVAIMMFFGACIWYIPPVIARLLYFDHVMAADIPNKADAAYAIVCQQVLPPGLVGLMAVSILAATMSSLDGSYNMVSALIVRNIYPPLAGLLHLPKLDDPKKQLIFGRCVNAFYGTILIILGLAFAFSNMKGGLYGYMLIVMALVGFPSAVPLMMAMFVRKAPSWAYFVSLGFGLVGSSFCFFMPQVAKSGAHILNWAWLVALAAGMLIALITAAGRAKPKTIVIAGVSAFLLVLLEVFLIDHFALKSDAFFYQVDIRVLWQHQLFIIGGMGMLGWLLSTLFWKNCTPEYQAKVIGFYDRMNHPVDFATEVGVGNDFRQFKMVGTFVIITGVLVSLLLIIPNQARGRITIGCISTFILILGTSLYLLGLRAFRRHEEQERARKEKLDAKL